MKRRGASGKTGSQRRRRDSLFRGRRYFFLAHLLITSTLVAACESSTTAPNPEDLDLDEIFAAPTPAERAQIEAEWSRRSPNAEGVVEEEAVAVQLGGGAGTGRIFSHLVDGHRHYGLIVVPNGAAENSLPLLVFAHPGDVGVSMSEVNFVLGILGERADDFVLIVPSFRSEALIVGARRFTSGGPPSLLDRDVDDALALMEVALLEVPEADPERIGALGYSRGGGVALLMGIRDSRIDLVIEFAGPTDFFGSYIRRIVEDAAAGRITPLPGVAWLAEEFLDPLIDGSIAPAEFRLELVRRSAVAFADRLPSTQIHHGTADAVVDVSQAKSLISALEALDRRDSSDESFLYDGAGHNPLQMSGSAARATAFIDRILQ